MKLRISGTFELEELDDDFLNKAVYMHYQVSTGLGGPGEIAWITGDCMQWVLRMESLEIPEHQFLRRFRELDALSTLLWKKDAPECFQRLDGWYGRDADMCLMVFVREDFFNAHSEEFLPFNGKTSFLGEQDTVLRLLSAEDRLPMLWSETARWFDKHPDYIF